MAEVDDLCGRPELLAKVDVVTVTAKGEPTLHSELGTILRHLKEKCRKPVAVLTNGTTLMDEAVRQDLMTADIVVPSLDAARPASFNRVDRPAAGVDLKAVIGGLTLFSHVFAGKIWLEILLVQGMNDTADDIEALVAVLRRCTSCIDTWLSTMSTKVSMKSIYPVDSERQHNPGPIILLNRIDAE